MTVYLCVYDTDAYEFSKTLYQDILAYLDGTEIAIGAADVPSRPLFPLVRASYSCDKTPSRRRSAARAKKEYAGPLDRGFAETLFSLIDARGMTDVECYKKANVDKRTFSKLKSNPLYRPSLKTAVAFAIALRLDMSETQALLATAGLALSGSRRFDKIVSYFITNGIYDVFEINQALFEFDQELLGST